MRFILYASLLFAILPVIFTRPFFGLCVYYVVSLAQPKIICWRPEFQDAMLVGVPLIVGAILFGVRRRQLIVDPPSGPKTRPAVRTRWIRASLVEWRWPVIIFAALVGYIGLTRLLVPFPMAPTSYQYRGLCKILLVTAILTGMAADLRRFRTLYLVIALSTAFWAIKGGIKVILLGPHQVYGKSYDNNLFALLSVMALPMLFYFGLSVRHARWRPLLLIGSALVCLGIIGSHSRAGFVAFAVVLIGMAWSSRYRLRAIFAVLLVVVVSMTLSGRQIRERVDSILTYRQDRSASSRFYTWEVALDLLKESPLIGVGFGNFETAKELRVGGAKAAHNIYLQNAAELGLTGHLLWLSIVFGTLFSLYRFMRRARHFPPDMRWAYYWSRGLFLAMVAFCIHGLFHNEEYLELMFAVVGLNMALRAATRREFADRRTLREAEHVSGARSPRHRSSQDDASPLPAPLHPGYLFPGRPIQGVAP